MSSSRATIEMTPAEVQEFLESNLKVQFATNGLAGFPHLTTLFYVLDEGRIAFWTYGKSQKVMNLRRDSRVTCLVEDGSEYHELRGVMITGRATLIEEYDAIAELGRRVVAAMNPGVDLGDLGEQVVTHQARKRVGVIIEPEVISSWDHRKMNQLPGGIQ